MYKTRISKWGLNKYLVRDDVIAIARKIGERQAIGKSSDVFLRDRRIDLEAVRRHINRRGIGTAQFYNDTSTTTPPHLVLRTPQASPEPPENEFQATIPGAEDARMLDLHPTVSHEQGSIFQIPDSLPEHDFRHTSPSTLPTARLFDHSMDDLITRIENAQGRAILSPRWHSRHRLYRIQCEKFILPRQRCFAPERRTCCSARFFQPCSFRKDAMATLRL